MGLVMLDSPVTTPTGRAERPAPRVVGAILLILAAVIHVIEVRDAETVTPVIGFALSAVSTLGGSLLLLTRGPRLGWFLGGGAAALTFVGYVLSRSVGLPGDTGDIGNWGEPLGVVSLVVEGLAVALAIWALTDSYRISPRIVREEIKAVTAGLTEGEPDSRDPSPEARLDPSGTSPASAGVGRRGQSEGMSS